MSVFTAVFRKELIDSTRDHRSLMAALIMPLVGPLLLAMMFTFIAEKRSDEKPVELPVVGRERAPTLIGHLEQHGVIVKEPPADPDAAVRDGSVHAVLVITDDYGDDFRAGKPARVELIVDGSNDEARTSQAKIRDLLTTYSRQIGSLRLLARGVPPDLAAAILVDETDLATPKKRAAELLGMIPMFAFLAAFMGGMNVAIDATAGERERHSLEPLLVNPASRLQVVLGKWAVTALFNIGAAGLTLTVFQIAMTRVPLHELGITVELGAAEVVKSLLLVVPVALFAAALLMVVSIFARSFKEAQTYLSVLMFVPMIPGFVLTLNPTKAKLWQMLIPTFGQNQLVAELIRGEALNPIHVAVATLVSLGAAAITLLAAAHLFGRERIIFGR